jgi:hypothetical protein
MPTVYYPPIVVELLSGKTREPLGGIDLTNYTVAISPLGPADWGEALLTQRREEGALTGSGTRYPV